MAHGDFIWCDLSALNPGKARTFYDAVMGWSWTRQDDQHVAMNGLKPAASLYQMPDKFMSMGMPSFWMSYIAVDDVEATAAQAEKLGGKVELGPEAYAVGGRYALIRDPLGAGFTVLEGEKGTRPTTAPGARAGHALFVSDASAIIPFYEALFGWSFGEDDGGAVRAVHLGDKPLFHCHEIPDPGVRGKEEYWAVLFNAATPRQTITKHAGRIEAEFNLPEGPAILARDPDGAAFIVLGQMEGVALPPAHGANWLPWVGLGLLATGAVSLFLWPWVAFILCWLFRQWLREDIRIPKLPPQSRDDMLFWLINAGFAAIAVASFILPSGG